MGMFKITHEHGSARTGTLKTRHGTVETPFFMPVATKAVGKFVGVDDYALAKTQAIICNAFILSLKPGLEVMKQYDGVHKFMNFDKTIFTDCGGFQMLRESFMQGTTAKGIQFTNPFNKQNILLTPEKIMHIEMTIKSDVAMMLDDVSPYGATKEQFAASLINTHAWAKESLKYHSDKKQLLFGIVQGGFYKDLREKSAKFIAGLDFDGVAIGGVAIGEPKPLMYKAVNYCTPFLPKEKPRYVMGVGSPEDIVLCVEKGIDCFDSVFPTMNARHNSLFTWKGKIDLDKGKYAVDKKPIDESCDCFVCKNFSKGYLHHLSKINEPAGKRYRSIHNIYFMNALMRKIRTAIKENTFQRFKKEFLKNFTA
ncbi:tRNA guanosine(34) transglycosylase Tgt [Candidatus Woesearchaeota archaeon]|nr:MAG: tRNA guanosine(34) transglycosylase Tgt [Candidatus Woesearchaeota archaeon]